MSSTGLFINSLADIVDLDYYTRSYFRIANLGVALQLASLSLAMVIKTNKHNQQTGKEDSKQVESGEEINVFKCN